MHPMNIALRILYVLFVFIKTHLVNICLNNEETSLYIHGTSVDLVDKRRQCLTITARILDAVVEVN